MKKKFDNVEQMACYYGAEGLFYYKDKEKGILYIEIYHDVLHRRKKNIILPFYYEELKLRYKKYFEHV